MNSTSLSATESSPERRHWNRCAKTRATRPISVKLQHIFQSKEMLPPPLIFDFSSPRACPTHEEGSSRAKSICRSLVRTQEFQQRRVLDLSLILSLLQSPRNTDEARSSGIRHQSRDKKESFARGARRRREERGKEREAAFLFCPAREFCAELCCGVGLGICAKQF